MAESLRLRERIAQTRRKRLEMTEPFERLITHRRVGVVESLEVHREFVDEAADHVETLLDQSEATLKVTAVSGHSKTLVNVSLAVKRQP